MYSCLNEFWVGDEWDQTTPNKKTLFSVYRPIQAQQDALNYLNKLATTKKKILSFYKPTISQNR